MSSKALVVPVVPVSLVDPVSPVSPVSALPVAKPAKQPDLNRKSRYTRQVIQEAFIELMREQPIERVTVTGISELADISRGTFYLHYRDAYDLLDCMENDFLAELEQRIVAKLTASTIDYSTDTGFWLDLLEGLLEAKDLAQLFFTNKSSSFLTKCLALNRSYAEALCKLEYPDITQRERDFMHTFYEYGSFSVIGLWVRDGFIEPPAQLAAILGSLNSKGVSS